MKAGFAWPAVFLLAAVVVAGNAAAAQQSLIERGEYLARAGDCIGCHTANGGAPLAGGVRIDTPFGHMLSSNITPDRNPRCMRA